MNRSDDKCKGCVCVTCDCNNALHSTDPVETCYGCIDCKTVKKPVKKHECIHAMKK